jgi:hypothetical protein
MIAAPRKWWLKCSLWLPLSAMFSSAIDPPPCPSKAAAGVFDRQTQAMTRRQTPAAPGRSARGEDGRLAFSPSGSHL